MAKYVAAVDQGTTSTRCMIFDHAGRVVAVDQKEHTTLSSVILGFGNVSPLGYSTRWR